MSHETRYIVKKINSINYGGRVIGTGLVFLTILPIGLYLINKVINSDVILIIQIISIAVGLIIEFVFGCILVIELRQDKIINDYYQKNPSSEKTPQQVLDDK